MQHNKSSAKVFSRAFMPGTWQGMDVVMMSNGFCLSQGNIYQREVPGQGRERYQSAPCATAIIGSPRVTPYNSQSSTDSELSLTQVKKVKGEKPGVRML